MQEDTADILIDLARNQYNNNSHIDLNLAKVASSFSTSDNLKFKILSQLYMNIPCLSFVDVLSLAYQYETLKEAADR